MNLKWINFFIIVVLIWTCSPKTEKLPNFDYTAESQLRTGPIYPPFSLQDEMYFINIDPQENFNGIYKKKYAHITISNQYGMTIHDFEASIKLRGQSSLNFPKKSYTISIADDKKQALLGMAKAKKYVLYAPYSDKTLLRNILAYNLGNLLGHYNPKTRLVILSIQKNSSIINLGIFVLVEKNEIEKDKIDIKKHKEQEVAYLLKVDKIKPQDFYIKSASDVKITIDYPKNKDLTPERIAWITNYMNTLENLMQQPESQEWQNIFDDKLDLNTAVDIFIIQELSRNIDAYIYSSFMYLPIHGKLHFGPLWDLDIAFGNANDTLQGWQVEERGGYLFPNLFKHPIFCARLKERWSDLRQNVLSNNTIFNIIDVHQTIVNPYLQENFLMWDILGRYVWPNSYWFKTYDDEIRALKSWIALRAEWMDTALKNKSCE